MWVFMPSINLETTEIYYEIHGQGEPLLLIHGLGSSSQDWEMQLPEFSSHFQVLNIDLRGHGRSSRTPGPYSMTLFAEDTARLIRALEFNSVHIIGISLGGMVAFQLALDYHDLVRSLVIVNSVPELIAHNFKDRTDYWKRLLIVRLFGLEKMGKVLAERFFIGPEHEAIRQLFVRRWAANHKPSYLASLKAAFGWSVLERLGEIQVPTLVIGADGDYFSNTEKERYTRLMPNAELIIIEDSRHALPAEKPIEFNKIVKDFLLNLT